MPGPTAFEPTSNSTPPPWRMSTARSRSSTPPSLTQRGKASAGLGAVEAQRKNRAALVDQRTREAEALAELKVSEGQVVTQGRKVADELMPVRYVAELLGIGADDERSIHWLILLMVLVCDPLAVALTAGVSSRRRG
jgi:hypothetical protein